MAAVLCLMLLPLMAAVGFMFGVIRGDLSPGAVLGGIVFCLLGAFMFFSAFTMSRIWEDEENR